MDDVDLARRLRGLEDSIQVDSIPPTLASAERAPGGVKLGVGISAAVLAGLVVGSLFVFRGNPVTPAGVGPSPVLESQVADTSTNPTDRGPNSRVLIGVPLDAPNSETIVSDVMVTSQGALAVGSVGVSGAVWILTEGAWSRAVDVPVDAAYLLDITEHREGFIAVGYRTGQRNRPVVWLSPDGYEWSEARQDFALDDSRMVAVTSFGGSELVAVGTGSDDGAAAWTSPDGESWQRSPTPPSAPGSTMSDVAVFNEKLVAVGEHLGDVIKPGIWRSHDGASWELSADPSLTPGAVAAIIFDDQSLVAVGTADGPYSAAWRSEDGETWNELSLPEGGEGLIGVTVSDGRYAAIGTRCCDRAGRPDVLVSNDGTSWVRADIQFEPAGSAVRAIEATASGFMLAGEVDGVPMVWLWEETSGEPTP